MPIEESSYRQAGLEAGQVRVPVLPELSQFGPALEKGMTDPLAAAGEQGGKIYNENFFGGKGLDLQSLGSTLTKTLTPAAGAIALIGQTSFNTWHDGVESIRVQTGALGKDLDRLTDSMEDVGGRVTQPLSEIGDTIGYVTQKTELTEQPLEDLTTRLAHLADITDAELKPSTETYLKLFGAWRIETDEMADSLDFLFRASQIAGRGPEELASDVLTARASLQALNIDFEESIGLASNFGGSFSKLYGGLRIAVGKLSEENRNVPKAFEESIDSIENAGSAAASNRKAIELFGSRAGPELALLIREGKFSLVDFNKELGRNQSGIEDTYDDMRTLGDQFAELRNQVAGAIGGAGQPIATVATIAAGAGPAITGVGAAIEWTKNRLLPYQMAAGRAGKSTSMLNAASVAAVGGLGKLGIAAAGVAAWQISEKLDDATEAMTYNANQSDTAVGRFANRAQAGMGPIGSLADTWENLNLAIKGEKDWLSALSPAYDTLFGDNEDLEEHLNKVNQQWLEGEITLARLRGSYRAAGQDVDILSGFIAENRDTVRNNRRAQEALGGAVDGVGDVVKRVGRTVVTFAGMTGKEIREWSRSASSRVSGVTSILDRFADRQKFNTRDVLRAFRRQVEAWDDYEKNLQRLSARDYPQQLVKSLTDMGLSGARLVEQLANATGKQRTRLIDMLKDVGLGSKDLREILGIELGQKTPEEVKKGTDKAEKHLRTGFGNMLGFTRDFARSFRQGINLVREDVGLGPLKVSTGPSATSFIPGLAGGTGDWRGGLARVGERGEEIIYLPQHGAVLDAHKTRAIPPEVRNAIPGFAKGTSNFGSLLSLLYPANDPTHPNHLHYESDSNASAIALAKAIEALKIIPRFIVSELEGYHNQGPISTGHKDGSAHYDGRAGDVNNRAGTSAAEQSDLANLADWIRNVTSGGTGTFLGSGVMLDPADVVRRALRGVPVPMFPGNLRPVGPAATRQLGSALLGQAENWIGDMGMGSAAAGGPWQADLRSLAAGYKWNKGAQWAALINLIMSESGGSNTAQNPTSTAFGRFQFLDDTWDDVGGHKTSDSHLQNVYGLRYVDQRYDSPIGAWAFKQAHNYYENGGWVREPVVGIGQRTGQIHHISESEAELVTPRSRVGGGRGIVRDVNITINVTGDISKSMAREMGEIANDKVIDGLEEYVRMNR